MEEEKIIDQSVLAEDVASQIKYQFLDFFLVKPLDPIKVKKEFSTPVAKTEPVKDDNGIEAQDFDERVQSLQGNGSEAPCPYQGSAC